MKRKNEVLEQRFQLALLVIDFSEALEEMRKYVIARQLLKSGTSIGANVREAQSCESRADFIHKLKIAHKEAEETEYWFAICKESKSYPNPSEEIEICLILFKDYWAELFLPPEARKIRTLAYSLIRTFIKYSKESCPTRDCGYSYSRPQKAWCGG